MDSKDLLDVLSSICTEIKDVKGELQQARLEILEKNKMISQMDKDIKALHASVAILSGQRVDGKTQSYIDQQNIQALNTVEAQARLDGTNPFKNR